MASKQLDEPDVDRLKPGDKTAEFTINFTYFKASGTYYTGGKKKMQVRLCDDGRTPYMYEVVEKVKETRRIGASLPGIVSSWPEGFVLIDCDEGYPCLIVPTAT